jgi:hypothetical protein
VQFDGAKSGSPCQHNLGPRLLHVASRQVFLGAGQVGGQNPVQGHSGFRQSGTTIVAATLLLRATGVN